MWHPWFYYVIFYILSIWGLQGGWSLSQLPLSEIQVTPRRNTEKKQDEKPRILTFTPTANLESPKIYVFGGRQKAGVPREISSQHGVNMQTPHRKPPVEIWTRSYLWRGVGAEHFTTVQLVHAFKRQKKKEYFKFWCVWPRNGFHFDI